MGEQRLTSLSQRTPAARGRRRFFRLACASLVTLVAVTVVSACLITSTPQYYPIKPGVPVLKAGEPDPHYPVVINTSVDSNAPVYFKAKLQSEDGSDVNAPGVQTELYIDYGTPSEQGPFRWGYGGPSFKASHFDLPREVIIPWAWEGSLKLGCHTATMVAARSFDPTTSCPTDLDNASAFITWFIVLCNSAAQDPFNNCASITFDTNNMKMVDGGVLATCPDQLVSCESYDAGTGGAGGGTP